MNFQGILVHLMIILRASKMQKYNFINKTILIFFYNAITLSLYNQIFLNTYKKNLLNISQQEDINIIQEQVKKFLILNYNVNKFYLLLIKISKKRKKKMTI